MPEEDSPDEDDDNESNDGSDDSEGMAARLDRILEGPPQADVVVPWTGDPKGASSRARDGQRGSLLHAILAPTPLPCLPKVGPSPTPNRLPRLRRATRLSLWRQGR